MCTARLETLHASVSVTTTKCCSWGGLQMNMFEQVSSDHHQMSVVESRVWCSRGGHRRGGFRSDVGERELV